MFLEFLGQSQWESSFLHVPRTVLEKVSCFDAPARLGTKGVDLRGISNTNCLSYSTSLFWYKSKITNLPSESWLKGKLKQYKIAFLSCYRHANQASVKSVMGQGTRWIDSVGFFVSVSTHTIPCVNTLHQLDRTRVAGLYKHSTNNELTLRG